MMRKKVVIRTRYGKYKLSSRGDRRYVHEPTRVLIERALTDGRSMTNAELVRRTGRARATIYRALHGRNGLVPKKVRRTTQRPPGPYVLVRRGK
jgi:hypothetical protein